MAEFLSHGWKMLHCVECYIVLNHSFLDGHLSCFHLGCCEQCCSEYGVADALLRSYGWLDCMEVLLLILGGTSMLFSIVFRPIYLPTSSA